MADLRRVRVEEHLEAYLKSHAPRVLGKSANQVTGADLTTLTNALLYEHKLALQIAESNVFGRFIGWLLGLVKPCTDTSAIPSDSFANATLEPRSLPQPQKDFDFDAADFANQWDEAA
jgi:hypothetical protein